jgi:hypothetical protein
MTRLNALVLVLAVAMSVAACSITDGTLGGALGGRATCWPEVPQRIPSLMKGVLTFGVEGPYLATPEGDELPLLLNRFDLAQIGSATALSDPAGGGIVAAHGDTVTLFGGLGADGSMYVCGVEERSG